MRSVLLFLTLLAACQAAPIVRNLKDSQLSFLRVAPTGNSVLYASPSTLDQPTLGVRTVNIRGSASAEGLTQAITVILYARAADPASACTAIGTLYRCEAALETPISAALTFSPAAPDVSLSLSSPILVEAVNLGKVWLGLRVVAGAGEKVTVWFRGMRAVVTLL
ncbi:MAG: hypothetical protein SFU83_12660 [Meiothermus sp.]|nr:hypothetical protein [Meiothermus sp.]